MFCLIGLRPNPLSLEIARISSALYSLIRGFDDAKVQRLLPDSKNLGEIFPELLRQGIIDATKLAQGAKSCRFLKLARRP